MWFHFSLFLLCFTIREVTFGDKKNYFKSLYTPHCNCASLSACYIVSTSRTGSLFSFICPPDNQNNYKNRPFSWLLGWSDEYRHEHYSIITWNDWAVLMEDALRAHQHTWGRYKGKNGWEKLYMDTVVKTENLGYHNHQFLIYRLSLLAFFLSSMGTAFPSEVGPWDLCVILFSMAMAYWVESRNLAKWNISRGLAGLIKFSLQKFRNATS